MTVLRCWCATTLKCCPRRSRARVPSPLRMTTTACTVPSMSLIHSTCQCFSPRSGQRCCGSPGSAQAEPFCGWRTNARSATTWSRASRRRRHAAGRTGIRVVAGVPVALCLDNEVDDARSYASEVLGHADFSPNYVRLLEHGDAQDVGDTMAAGDESTVLARLQRYRDAGVTDLAARVVPLGSDAKARTESRRRTQDFLASLCP